MSLEILESAIAYRENGIQVLPVPYGSKKAEIRHKEFQEKWIPQNEISTIFQDSNIAGLGGSISNNLAILDVDDYSKFNSTLAKNKRFQEMRMATWESISASGRPHIFLRTHKPIKGTNQIKTLGTEIRGQGLYAILPPSVFLKDGQGLLYTWSRREGKILELNESETEDLRKIFPFEYYEPNEKRDKPFGMSWKFFEILCFGEFEKYGFVHSRSEGEFQILLHLINLDWSDSQILSLIQEKAHPKTRFKIRGIQHCLNEIYKAREWAKDHKSKIIQTLDELQSSIPKIDWHSIGGRSSLTDRLVFEYFVTAGKRSHKLNLGLSQREVAENLGKGVMTIQRSIARLLEVGFIDKTRSNDIFNACEYSIKTETPKRYILAHNGQEKDCIILSLDSKNDSWRKSKSKRQSLLKTGMLVYNCIQSNPGISNKEIFDKNQGLISLRTIQRKTKHLLELGAILKEDNETYRVSSMSLNEIAYRIDSQGAAERQKEFHKSERAIQKKFAKATPEERENAKREFYLSKNKNLRRISQTEFLNPKTGEIFSILKGSSEETQST